ncbi:hypothetical protein [Burkholderia perseverans]|uniref:FliH/SctL family protein n=1 Tax=Burkholderia perseverans TaxID=2615214 RepID=UPI001FF05E9E|nr:hypothetical protein [Burkholderia perseverans]
MSTLLKAEQVVLSSRRLALAPERIATPPVGTAEPAPAAHAPAPPPGADAFAPEREQLTARIAELEAKLAGRLAEREHDTRAAFGQGVEQGRQEAARMEDERIAALAGGVARARDAFASRLAELDRLATELALVGLERVLGDPARYAELVAGTVRHRLRSIADGSVVEVRVSAADFPDAARLDAMRDALGAAPAVALVADPGLAAGACVIGLTLGRLDAGVPPQLASLASSLREIGNHA